MEFNREELIITWFALLVEQGNLETGTAHWFRHERLIRKIEKRLGMRQRPLLKEVE